MTPTINAERRMPNTTRLLCVCTTLIGLRLLSIKRLRSTITPTDQFLPNYSFPSSNVITAQATPKSTEAISMPILTRLFGGGCSFSAIRILLLSTKIKNGLSPSLPTHNSERLSSKWPLVRRFRPAPPAPCLFLDPFCLKMILHRLRSATDSAHCPDPAHRTHTTGLPEH